MTSSLIILGAGASGLLSALALADRYEDILLIDRYWPDSEGHSQGIPQCHHLQILLAEGQKLLSELLPEVWQALSEGLLPEVDWGREVFWKNTQGLLLPNDAGVKTYLFSRPRLNQVLWSQCKRTKNIRTLTASIHDWEVVDGCITQLHFKDGGVFPVAAHVLDARGRSSNLQRQLTLSSQEVKNQYRYFSTRLQRGDWQTSLKAQLVYIQACPKKQPIGLVLSPIEDQEMILTLIDTTGTIKTDKQKQEAVRRLFEEQQLGSLQNDLTDWVSYANLHNKRLLLDLRQWPRNLLAIGDSICYQNPSYGQGLTVVLKQVHLLRQQKKGLWQNQKQLHRSNWMSWLMASQQDKSSETDTVFQGFLQRVFKHSTKDPAVGKILVQVLHHSIGPWRLLSPKLFFI